ncbi:MAG: hypothetical protein OFPI_15170 [Osedax symbiont Rs2]|nr:MAG: hypothetical protein OFPI_15170 [Osedax symbiont Rs2]
MLANGGQQVTTTLLKINNLSHRFAQRGTVLDNVSFTLNSGDKLALTGANGAGKSTLLQLLVGLIPRQSGDILAQDKLQKTEADFIKLRQQVGLVFQDPDDQLFCPSVLEDVMFGPLNQGFTVIEARQNSQKILKKLGLEHLSDRIASELSGGEKRLVTLATVLVMQPKVLLLDEPTNALDTQAKQKLLALLQSLDQAMLIISHDQLFLQQLATGYLELKDAKLKRI